MPQTNITYDTPYNKKLVERLKDLDEKKMFHSYDAYHPSPMGYRMGTFHGQYSEPPVMKGGVAPSKYILNGNSPAYPPMSMNAGIAVHSGGARGYAGMDGAVGCKFSFSDFTKGVADVGKAVAPFAHLLLAAGREEKKGGKFSLKGLNKGIKSAVDIAKTGKDAYDLYSSIAGAGTSGGMSLKDVLESTKRIGRDAVGEVKKRGKAAGKDLIKQVGRAAKKSLAESVNKSAKDVVAATGGGRAARAAIVKKVMAEKGLKLIEASKYVKQHGLY